MKLQGYETVCLTVQSREAITAPRSSVNILEHQIEPDSSGSRADITSIA